MFKINEQRRNKINEYFRLLEHAGMIIDFFKSRVEVKIELNGKRGTWHEKENISQLF